LLSLFAIFVFQFNDQLICSHIAQLAEIKKVTFSRIICDNSDKSITTIQPQAFLAADA